MSAGFDVDYAIGCDCRLTIKQVECLSGKKCVVGRVDKDNVELIKGLAQISKRITTDDINFRCAEQFTILSQAVAYGTLMIDHGDLYRPTGQCFEPKHPTTGKQVQTAGPVDERYQPVEEGFPNTIWRRTERLAGVEPNQPMTPMAGNNTNGMPSSQGVASCGLSDEFVGVIGQPPSQ
jgi:hypothetical protein